MIFEYECIVKTAKSSDGEILWQSIYVDSKKVAENYIIDLTKLLKIYAPNSNWKEVLIIDNDTYSLLEDYFPEYDDFSYLLDYTDISINKTIYLLNGVNKVSKVWNDYRHAGYYDRFHWEDIGGKWYSAKYSCYLEGHHIQKFMVENSEEIFIWDDWNYQQSFLYLNYKQ